MEKEVSKEELERRRKSMKILKTLMIILDVLTLILLVLQIIIKDVTYWSYLVLIVCNIITFSVRIEPKKKKSSK